MAKSKGEAVKEKIILPSPGVFMGLSTTKAHEGESALFYDNDELIFEVDLTTAHHTKRSLLPGIEKYIFFKHNIRMLYPEEAENDIEVFVSDR